jgi:hypothetical protein
VPQLLSQWWLWYRHIGKIFIAKGERGVVIGRDGRLSGVELMSALKEGLKSTGCHVVDIGINRSNNFGAILPAIPLPASITILRGLSNLTSETTRSI